MRTPRWRYLRYAVPPVVTGGARVAVTDPDTGQNEEHGRLDTALLGCRRADEL